MKKVIAALLILFASLFLGSREGSAFLLDAECGRSLPTNAKLTWWNYFDSSTDIQANPWIVSVIVNGKAKCSGSLINHRFVLTAAHCVFREAMQVHLGDFDAWNPGQNCSSGARLSNAYCVRIDKKIVHAGFGKIQAQQYDIGLLRMQHAVQYSDFVRPICLLINEPVAAIDRFQLTVWGTTAEGFRSIPRVLKHSVGDRIDRELCTLKFQQQVDESQICVHTETSHACKGDSGGPFSAKILYGGTYRTFQFGIIIFGLSSCAGLSVCTNVTFYMDWIWDALVNLSA
uniref:CG14227-PB n=1 Tax=Drosophila melanogaster TaxID=7227 RepID=G3KKR5_DROME|nr:CG14227-PB [Drosophila melanogaster]AEO11986.1 CG14227-PB [Drosophila melanogaster]AEO11989.1 CG14227-PB [Drosophila melanogaster]AEO11990.1 CG14227-PB [Drosophila melanogaster]AEO11991.1 CG14227-PB [Drosophila melanogaster]